MYQQHNQFEEASNDKPQPISPYQESGPPAYSELPFQSYQHEAGQKLMDHSFNASRPRPRHLPLALLSLFFVLVLFAIPFLNVGAKGNLAIAIVFTVVVLVLNVFLIARRD